MLSSQRKILLLGPSGAGKSTLCNAIFNQKVDLPNIAKPAGVCSRAMGVTSEIKNYWCDNSLVLTDTIGFDDPRFEPKVIAEELRKMLRCSDISYEKVILCLKLGRVTEAARVYLRLLKAIFVDPGSNMILYVSGCEDGTTVEQFIENNMILGDDEDIQELITSLNKQTKKNKEKGIELENIITGTMQSHQNRATDEKKFLDDRQETLEKIMAVINTDIGVAKVKRPESMWKSIKEWIMWLFAPGNIISGARKQLRSAGAIIQFAFNDDVVPIKYFYGECSICLQDDNDSLQKWIITPCSHKFHGDCFQRLLSKNCPLCNTRLEEDEDVHDLP